MKLERLGDNQIRCILSRSDLEKRKLGLAELACGSEKAKDLFQDMMQQASAELGFEVNNIPLMIEAIPVSMDCLILVITKVEDPEELENRLPNVSNILRWGQDEDSDEFDNDDEFEDMMPDEFDDIFEIASDDISDEPLPFIDGPVQDEDVIHFDNDGIIDDDDIPVPPKPFDILGMFSKSVARAKEEMDKKDKEKTAAAADLRIYSFDRFDDIIRLSGSLSSFFKGDSLLYKDESEKCYYLVLKKGTTSDQDFTRACVISSDYGSLVNSGYATLNFFTEHFKPIFKENALSFLKQLA